MKDLRGPKAKIQKLLKLAGNNTSAAEAAAAMEKAAEIAEQHSLNLAEIQMETGSKFGMVQSEVPLFYPGGCYELRFITPILEKFFFCLVTVQKATQNTGPSAGTEGELVFVHGHKEMVEIGEYVVQFLVQTYRDLWNKQVEKGVCSPEEKKQKDSYFSGLTKGLSLNLNTKRSVTPKKVQKSSNLTALVALNEANVNEMEKELEKECEVIQDEITPQEKRDYFTELTGRSHGAKINIFKPLQAEKKQLQ